MQLLVRALKNGMSKEKEIYSNLLALATEKKEVLIKNDMARLDEIQQMEGEALEALQSLNTMQNVTLEKIAQKKHLSESPDLTGIIELLQDEREKDELRVFQQDFQALIIELQEKNELNQRLLETHLQYTSFCIEMMTQGDAVGDLYGNTGHVADEPAQRRGFINREV